MNNRHNEHVNVASLMNFVVGLVMFETVKIGAMLDLVGEVVGNA